MLQQFEVFGVRINEVLPGRSSSLITRVSCVLSGNLPNWVFSEALRAIESH